MLVHSWLNPKLEVRDSKGGRGIFAKNSIAANERLAIFGGNIMRSSEEPVFSCGLKDLSLQIDEEFIIGTRHESDIEDTDYFNHSCSPNAGFKGQIFLVALHGIVADEEITFDYAMVLHETEGVESYSFECLCGSSNCRGKITDNDWKIPELQKRYDGYFQYYLQEKINNLKKSALEI